MIFGFQFGLGRSAACALGCLIVLTSVAHVGAETIRHQDPDFTLKVPDGFTQPSSVPAGISNMFVREKRQGSPAEALVTIQVLDGTIGHEHAKLPGNAPAGAHFTTVQWKGHEISELVSDLTQSGVRLTCRIVQIPLEHKAIQMTVAVPLDKEWTIDSVVDQFLAGLDGPSSWPAAAAPAQASPPLATTATPAGVDNLHSRQDTIIAILIMVSILAIVVSAILVVILIIRKIVRRMREPARSHPSETRQGHALKIGMRTAFWAFAVVCLISYFEILFGHARQPLGNAEALGTGLIGVPGSFGLIASCIAYAVSANKDRDM